MESVLDLQGTLSRLDDDQVLLRELAEIFLDQAASLLGQIQAAVMDADAKGLRQAAHALKGSAGTLGGTAVYASADRLERMGRDGILGDSQAACATLETDLEQFMAELRQLVAEERG